VAAQDQARGVVVLPRRLATDYCALESRADRVALAIAPKIATPPLHWPSNG
jgi:hypothetical protein